MMAVFSCWLDWIVTWWWSFRWAFTYLHILHGFGEAYLVTYMVASY